MAGAGLGANPGGPRSGRETWTDGGTELHPCTPEWVCGREVKGRGSCDPTAWGVRSGSFGNFPFPWPWGAARTGGGRTGAGARGAGEGGRAGGLCSKGEGGGRSGLGGRLGAGLTALPEGPGQSADPTGS